MKRKTLRKRLWNEKTVNKETCKCYSTERKEESAGNGKKAFIKLEIHGAIIHTFLLHSFPLPCGSLNVIEYFV